MKPKEEITTNQTTTTTTQKQTKFAIPFKINKKRPQARNNSWSVLTNKYASSGDLKDTLSKEDLANLLSHHNETLMKENNETISETIQSNDTVVTNDGIFTFFFFVFTLDIFFN